MVSNCALSYLNRLFVLDRTEFFKFSCSHYNPSTWALWRALVWEFRDLPLLNFLDSTNLARQLQRISRLSRDISSGVISLTDGCIPGSDPLLSGFSPDFRLSVNRAHPAESEILELFTGRTNPRGFKFLPLGWPYPIRHTHVEKGTHLMFLRFPQGNLTCILSLHPSCF